MVVLTVAMATIVLTRIMGKGGMWILEFSEFLYVVTFIPAITDLHRIVMKAVAVLDAYLMIARTIISNGHLNQAGMVI